MAFVLPLRLHEICEGHRLLTLRGRGCELQAVSGPQDKASADFLSEDCFPATKNRLCDGCRFFFGGVLNITLNVLKMMFFFLPFLRFFFSGRHEPCKTLQKDNCLQNHEFFQ